MRLTLLIASFLLIGGGAAVAEEAAPHACSADGSSRTYYVPQGGYRVTIESANGVVSVLEVPDGVFLNIDSAGGIDIAERMDAPGLPRTFRGDLTIRTRRADEMAENESRLGRDIMAKAPLEISLRGATVRIEKAGE